MLKLCLRGNIGEFSRPRLAINLDSGRALFYHVFARKCDCPLSSLTLNVGRRLLDPSTMLYRIYGFADDWRFVSSLENCRTFLAWKVYEMQFIDDSTRYKSKLSDEGTEKIANRMLGLEAEGKAEKRALGEFNVASENMQKKLNLDMTA